MEGGRGEAGGGEVRRGQAHGEIQTLRIGKGAIVGRICGFITASKVKAHKRKPKRCACPRNRRDSSRKRTDAGKTDLNAYQSVNPTFKKESAKIGTVVSLA